MDSVAALFVHKFSILNLGGRAGSGGRGGRDGYNGSKLKPNGFDIASSLFNLIIPGRGIDGISGLAGDFGDEPTFEVLSDKRLNHLLSSLNQNQ